MGVPVVEFIVDQGDTPLLHARYPCLDFTEKPKHTVSRGDNLSFLLTVANV